MVIECTFGCLKACCSFLGVALELRLKNTPSFGAAACILHSVCKMRGETCLEMEMVPAGLMQEQAPGPLDGP